MTGSLERPSQRAPETRKARTRRVASYKDAFRAVHALERQLLAAAQRTDMQTALMRVDGEVAGQRGGLLAAARGRFGGMRAALATSLSSPERAAALAHIHAEESAETERIEREMRRERMRRRGTVAGSLRLAQRSVRAALAEQQKRERARVIVAREGKVPVHRQGIRRSR